MGKIMLNEIDYSGGNANVIRLTQAEYDALPPSKLTDNNVYMITDVNGDGSQFQPVIYSEDEREIGVWVDGKPLYQKTINFGAMPNNTIKTVSHNIANVDKIWVYGGFCYNILTFESYYFNRPTNELKYQWETSVDTVNVFMHDFADFSNDYNVYIILQYTKTTDTAGSGTWTPQGVPAVHYSTDEQVVGTWVDGSTIYQKTVEFTSELTVNSNSWTDTPISNSGMRFISNAIGYWNSNGGGACYTICATCDAGNYVKILQTRNTAIALSGITVQYTKSSQGGN